MMSNRYPFKWVIRPDHKAVILRTSSSIRDHISANSDVMSIEIRSSLIDWPRQSDAPLKLDSKPSNAAAFSAVFSNYDERRLVTRVTSYPVWL